MIFTDGPVVPGSGIVFGGPYEGFTAPSKPGETDKELLIKTHLAVFKVRNCFILISYTVVGPKKGTQIREFFSYLSQN